MTTTTDTGGSKGVRVTGLITLIVGIIFIGLNLITDLLYRLLDPRTR